MIEKVKETVSFLEENGFSGAETGIILGTGLGELVHNIEITHELSYREIPHFPVSTVEFHKGKLLRGTLEGKEIIAMQGRFHYYEGYSMPQLVFPVRVMHQMKVKRLLISNAGGNMNKDWKKGEIMLINDHINMLPDGPLRGKEAAEFGNIFVDMGRPYDEEINEKLRRIAKQENIPLREGVYTAVMGPNLETRAEYRFLRNIGADVVGMSTIPEVIAANQIGLPVAAVSVMTDDCDPDNLAPIDIEDILATAKEAEKDLVALFKKLVGQL